MRRLLPLLTALLVAAPALGQEATFTPLGDLPGGTFESHAYGVSPDGRVAVGQGSVEGAGEAFRWETGVMAGLGDLPGGVYASIGWAASWDGSVVVGDSWSANGTFEAFRWTEGTGMVGLGDLPGGAFESTAYDVTPDGAVVVGEGNPGGPINPSAAFRWEGGVMTRLPDLPGDEDRCGARAVSADGRVVAGWGINADEGREAARWVDGAVEGLGFPEGATGTVAFDLSADGGVAVGTAFTPSGTSAFIWTEGAGMAFLPDLPGGSPYREARAVSGDGRVAVGVGDSGAAFEVFIWT
ncbi:MAG TPA: hypothetical protein VD962_00310, partial [Rubricoccaceae bacterium]|nr:hypothetical protein [Rubricoccaceae bacterium]